MSFLFWMLEDFVKKGDGVKLKRISTDRDMWLRLCQNFNLLFLDEFLL